MKILLVTESYWPNRDGGSVIERALVHGLGDLGHDVRVVAPSPTGPAYVEHDGKSDIYRVRSFRLPGKFGKFGARTTITPRKTLRTLVEKWLPDVIHGHNFFPIGRTALKLAHQHQIPYVATNHNMPDNTARNIGPFRHLIPSVEDRLWNIEIKHLNQANFVVSPTQTGLDILLSHGLSVPSRPISNGVDLIRYQPGAADKDLLKKFGLPKKPIVSYMGRLDGEKQMDIWLQSVPYIRKEIDAHFLIGGRGGEAENLKKLASQLGMARHVTFAGMIEDDDMAGFYRLGSVFAISSPAELQSLVTLEAMACGRPVVACDAGALPELCKSGRNGYLFLVGDPTGMAKSIVRILQNPTMGEKMGAESRRIVETTHDVKKMPANYESVYREVAGEAS